MKGLICSVRNRCVLMTDADDKMSLEAKNLENRIHRRRTKDILYSKAQPGVDHGVFGKDTETV